MLEDVLAASRGVGDAQQSAIPPCHFSYIRFLEHTIGGASILANLSNVWFLERTIGGAFIAAKLINVRFLKHTVGGAYIAANLNNVRFLEQTSLLLDVWFAAADFQWVCKCAGFQNVLAALAQKLRLRCHLTGSGLQKLCRETGLGHPAHDSLLGSAK